MNEEIVVTTWTPYEQQQFISRTDWRIRAVSSTNLHLRTSHIYVHKDEEDPSLVLVFPKNILKKFITIADLKTHIGGYLYGLTPSDHQEVREVRCIVMVPQVGSHQSVTFPKLLPDHPYLKDLQPLGWVHTQPAETSMLSPSDVMFTANIVTDNENWAEASSVVTVSLTPGSCTLSAYRLTPVGIEWGKNAKDTSDFSNAYFKRVQLLLTDKFFGFFMVPDNGVWNCNFTGIGHSLHMKYGLVIDNPKEFYHDIHRPSHFLQFAKAHQEEKQTFPEIDDNFS
jgi:pre-mRNA-processing factor 8